MDSAALSEYIVGIFKQPTWINPINSFMDESCGIFEDVEENKLEYTGIHNAFKSLVDNLLSAHLSECSISEEQFAQFCQDGLSEGNLFHRDLVQQLLAFDDFLVFKAVMVKRNAELCKEALEKQAVNGEEAVCDLPPQNFVEANEELLAEERDRMEAERLELQRRCVEAELQLAMALSEQLQKRLELMEALTEVLETLTKMHEAEAALQAENAAADNAAVAAATAGGAAECLPDALYVAPLDDQAYAEHILEQERIEALRQRERAGRAVACSKGSRHMMQQVDMQPMYIGYQSAWGSAPGVQPETVPEPQQVQQPTAEQKQARAEHLKRQRDMLVQKKNRDRQAELSVFQQTHGPSAAARAAESACARAPAGIQEYGGPSSPSGIAGRNLARELSGQAAVEAASQAAAVEPDKEAKAAEMRRMLTRQLKQTLSGSLSGGF